jgi:hypothetical protein
MIPIANRGNVDTHLIGALTVVDGLVSVTQQAWRAAQPTANIERSTTRAQYAPAAVRDQFLAALEASDGARLTELASGLMDCSNPLPGMTCGELDVPLGSTYGDAARRIVQQRGARVTNPSEDQVAS